MQLTPYFKRRFLATKESLYPSTETVLKGMAQAFFFVKNALFLRTEMDNLRSNLTEIWTCSVSSA
jgi:hypothetical protein